MSITWRWALFGGLLGALCGIIVALIAGSLLSPGASVAFLIGELAGGISTLTGVWLGAKYGLRREFP